MIKRCFCFLLIFLSLQSAMGQAAHPKLRRPKPPEVKIRLPAKSEDRFSERDWLNDDLGLIIDHLLEKLWIREVIVCVQADSGAPDESYVLPISYFNVNDEAIVVTASSLSGGSGGGPVNLELSLKFYEFESKQFIGDLVLTVSQPQGSRKQLFNKLKKKIEMELKRIYWFSADTKMDESGNLIAPVGKDQHVKPGLFFDVYAPDRELQYKGQTIRLPAGRVGLAVADRVDKSSSRMNVLRQWQQPAKGGWVVERDNQTLGVSLNTVIPADGMYMNCGVMFHGGAVHRWDWGFGAHVLRITDSFLDNEWGFGFAGMGIWRFLNTSRLDLGIKWDLILDLVFRKDDQNEVVNAALFSTTLGFVVEYPLNVLMDLVVAAGYRVGTKTERWEFSDEEETYPAYWEYVAPRIEVPPLAVSAGIKFIFY